MRGTTSFTIGPEHPTLPGHFPGFPIVPGVLLLDEVLRTLEAVDRHARWRIAQAKFLKPVRPGETLALEQEPGADGTVHFRVLCAGQAVAVGTLIPARPVEHGERAG